MCECSQTDHAEGVCKGQAKVKGQGKGTGGAKDSLANACPINHFSMKCIVIPLILLGSTKFASYPHCSCSYQLCRALHGISNASLLLSAPWTLPVFFTRTCMHVHAHILVMYMFAHPAREAFVFETNRVFSLVTSFLQITFL